LSFAGWSGDPYVARVVDLTHERSLVWLLEQYGGARPKVLQAVLSHAFSLGARTAIIEYRYVDQDWRNEHKAFYTGTFRRYPSVAGSAASLVDGGCDWFMLLRRLRGMAVW
jgi:hypothetical protein